MWLRAESDPGAVLGSVPWVQFIRFTGGFSQHLGWIWYVSRRHFGMEWPAKGCQEPPVSHTGPFAGGWMSTQTNPWPPFQPAWHTDRGFPHWQISKFWHLYWAVQNRGAGSRAEVAVAGSPPAVRPRYRRFRHAEEAEMSWAQLNTNHLLLTPGPKAETTKSNLDKTGHLFPFRNIGDLLLNTPDPILQHRAHNPEEVPDGAPRQSKHF